VELRNDSGMLTEEEWLGYISLKAQFNEILGQRMKNESTQQAESSTNEATEHKAE
jgi:hypothetical protein